MSLCYSSVSARRLFFSLSNVDGCRGQDADNDQYFFSLGMAYCIARLVAVLNYNISPFFAEYYGSVPHGLWLGCAPFLHSRAFLSCAKQQTRKRQNGQDGWSEWVGAVICAWPGRGSARCPSALRSASPCSAKSRRRPPPSPALGSGGRQWSRRRRRRRKGRRSDASMRGTLTRRSG